MNECVVPVARAGVDSQKSTLSCGHVVAMEASKAVVVVDRIALVMNYSPSTHFLLSMSNLPDHSKIKGRCRRSHLLVLLFI